MSREAKETIQTTIIAAVFLIATILTLAHDRRGAEVDPQNPPIQSVSAYR